MKKLPIKGEGLGAIIKDTLASPPEPSADPEEIARLKKALEEEASKAESYASKVEESETAAQNLSREVDELRKKLDEEIPRGDAREMLIDTMRETAKKFDAAGNILDSFHLYRRILRINPDDLGALYEIATIYYSAGLASRAAECLRALLELAPNDSRAAENLAAIEEELAGG